VLCYDGSENVERVLYAYKPTERSPRVGQAVTGGRIVV
jgi:hypothetical protein